jgi:hypothetical protein
MNTVSMNKDTIVQFVCFASVLEPDEFMEMWESYASFLVDDPANILLQVGMAERNNNRFNYVLQHVCSAPDFRFAFMKEGGRSHPADNKARITQAGGYLPVQLQSPYNNVKGDTRIVAFVGHSETELDFYRGQTFHCLDIYEAYFENCAYSYVLQFFLQEQEARVLLAQLKARHGVEAALYKEYRFSHYSKKASGSLL